MRRAIKLKRGLICARTGTVAELELPMINAGDRNLCSTMLLNRQQAQRRMSGSDTLTPVRTRMPFFLYLSMAYCCSFWSNELQARSTWQVNNDTITRGMV